MYKVSKIMPKIFTEVIKMEYSCCHCFYVYSEKDGEPDCDIEKGTKFEDTPEDFECPLCHTAKDAFILKNT